MPTHLYNCVRFAPQLYKFLLKEFENQSDYLQIISAAVRYYDTYCKTTTTTQCLFLAHGAATYLMTCNLSDRLGGQYGVPKDEQKKKKKSGKRKKKKKNGKKEEKEDKKKTYVHLLDGKGAPKIMDFCLHNPLAIMKLKVAPGTVTERINEASLTKVPKIMKMMCEKVPLKQIAEEASYKIHSYKEKTNNRRRSERKPFPKPHNLYFHKCCINSLHSVRVIAQLLWAHNYYSEYCHTFFHYYSTGSICTDTYFEDKTLKKQFNNVCICQEKFTYESDGMTIQWNEYESIITKKIKKLSKSSEDKELNNRFPGLHKMRDDELLGDPHFERKDEFPNNTITIMHCATITCFCNQRTGNRQMVKCKQCGKEDHFDCAKESNADDTTLDTYICIRCDMEPLQCSSDMNCMESIHSANSIERMDVDSDSAQIMSFTDTTSTQPPLNIIEATDVHVNELIPKPTDKYFSDDSLANIIARAESCVSACGPIANSGTDCYCNSVLQLLLNSAIFRAFLERSSHSDNCPKTSGQHCWLCTLLHIYPQINDNKTTYDPTQLVQSLSGMFYIFLGFCSSKI